MLLMIAVQSRTHVPSSLNTAIMMRNATCLKPVRLMYDDPDIRILLIATRSRWRQSLHDRVYLMHQQQISWQSHPVTDLALEVDLHTRSV